MGNLSEKEPESYHDACPECHALIHVDDPAFEFLKKQGICPNCQESYESAEFDDER